MFHPLQHFALIPDGTRRWAAQHSVSLETAYEAVVGALVRISDTVFTHEVTTLSVFVLSNNNLLRDQDDLNATFRSHIRIFNDVLPGLSQKWDATIRHVGDSTRLPVGYAEALSRACEGSRRHCCGRTINICAAYSLDWELKSRSSHDGMLNGGGLFPPNIDIVLRTGGEFRLSGFLPIQVQYAELFFMSKLFPDIQADDIEDVIREYANRNRRFGR